jgi:alkanesulfonate monooxygenase SsuD/methylene tetrahydromethanopterin reductase-like flavin-dependent oxidoreductase (luciferase family)
MRVCLMIEGQEGVTWEQWVALADAAEAAGLEGLFRSDHYKTIVRGGEAGSLDAWATLAALAARTEKLRLGTLVSPVTFRHPAVLARNVVTVDEISGGRAQLGMGAGWYEAEHAEYGIPFPPTRERMDELDRQLGEVRRWWKGWTIVGGKGKPRTVAAAVRHADEYNTFSVDPEGARERRQVLEAAAERAGRDPLVFSAMVSDREILSGTVEAGAARLREYEAAGVERAMIQHLQHEDVEAVALLGEIARLVA